MQRHAELAQVTEARQAWLLYERLNAEKSRALEELHEIMTKVEKLQAPLLAPVQRATVQQATGEVPTVEAFFYEKDALLMTPAVLVFYLLQAALHVNFAVADGLASVMFLRSKQGKQSLTQWIAYVQQNGPRQLNVTSAQVKEVFLMGLRDQKLREQVEQRMKLKYEEPQNESLEEWTTMTLNTLNTEVQTLHQRVYCCIAQGPEKSAAEARLKQLYSMAGQHAEDDPDGRESTERASRSSRDTGGLRLNGRYRTAAHMPSCALLWMPLV
jgi:hypothetical protein